jgi:hypothetical protein
MKYRPAYGRSLTAGVFALAMWARGQALEPFTTDKATAMAEARRQGKLVFLISGRDDCSNCLLVKEYSLQATNPPVRQLFEECFVYWNCPQDKGCTSYLPYVTDQPDGFPIPLICLIDPSTPATQNAYLMRLFGPFDPGTLLTYFRRIVLPREAPQFTNLSSNGTISTPAFTVQGTMAVTNVPITRLCYQLNGGAWSNMVSDIDWAVPLPPGQVLTKPAVNTLSVYAKDIGGYKSLTNTISFTYDPNPVAATAISPRIQGTNAVISWPDSSATWNVEAADSLRSPLVWRPASVVPTLQNGRWQAALPLSHSTNVFFRLRSR